MAKVTWLGEGSTGPQEMEWGGKLFKIGEPVDLDDLRLVAKAANNRFFEVSGITEVPPTPATVIPPSQEVMPGAVPKPGEPIGGAKTPLRKV